MSPRGRMTMRADVERNTAVGTDAHGLAVAPVFTALATLPCFVWSNAKREISDGDKTTVIEDMRAMFALNAAIMKGDQVASVKDRLGTEILPGRMKVEAIQRKHNHVETVLELVA